jgi:hypothetical protein
MPRIRARLVISPAASLVCLLQHLQCVQLAL